MKRSPSDYKAMAQWQHDIGSNQYYIDWLQSRAAREGAPLDSIYINNQENTWVTVRDLNANHPFRKTWRSK